MTSHEIRESGTPLFSAEVADGVLTPEQALDYLGELSPDIRASVLIDGDGSAVAASVSVGEDRAEPIAELALDLLERIERMSPSERVQQLEVSVPSGAVFALRQAGWTLVVVATRMALSSLMFLDIRSALARLEARAA